MLLLGHPKKRAIPPWPGHPKVQCFPNPFTHTCVTVGSENSDSEASMGGHNDDKFKDGLARVLAG